ncbi:MAG: ligand-binding protein SH3, partial [Variovorax sp.]
MSKLAQRWIGVGVIALGLPVAAAAQQAFAHDPLNLRAGPSGEYPVVARLGPGQPLQVLGCTRGYGWCDVVLPDGLRGWVFARGLDYAYEDRRVPLATYGSVIGVPIVTFAIGSYWSNYYRDRPWYREPRWWGDYRPPPPVPGWRPPPPPAPNWRPRPWPGPGYDPHPGHRPRPPDYRPPAPPGYRPPHDGGMRPPHDGGVRPPRPRPPDVQPPQLPHPPRPGAGGGGRPPGGGPPGQGAPPVPRPPGNPPGPSIFG